MLSCVASPNVMGLNLEGTQNTECNLTNFKRLWEYLMVCLIFGQFFFVNSQILNKLSNNMVTLICVAIDQKSNPLSSQTAKLSNIASVYFYNNLLSHQTLKNIFIIEVIISDQNCGKNDNNDVKFIAGAKNHAEDNPVGKWPWMASLGFLDDENHWIHKCGATLISTQHFLTAAHCADKK